nr:RNA-guided endonuclease TnpB family protein [Protofrankia coriariae]
MPTVRYRYRAYPTPGQAQALARAFGCARVVYNNAIRTRDAAHAAGEKISDTEVQRRVVTLARQAPERVWLAEVSSVVLVQACQDARRAFRNWFDSLSGKRKGREVGHPRFRSRKDRRQSIRLTRNGFTATSRGVRVAKVGDVALVWSRELPSVPSSATVIREADGRYYVSFVVDVTGTAYPPTDSEIGIDLGLDRLATLSTGEVVANPRHLRSRQRGLARAQRALARKKKGSVNRRLAVRVWTCPACGIVHDRDLNAARNVLFEGQRIVAAGRAETENACGAGVRPPRAVAVGGEAGTHRGVT